MHSLLSGQMNVATAAPLLYMGRWNLISTSLRVVEDAVEELITAPAPILNLENQCQCKVLINSANQEVLEWLDFDYIVIIFIVMVN